MPSPGELIQRCLDHFHRGRLAAAIRIAREAIQAFPDDGEAWQLYGLLQQRNGDVAGACAALETASLLVPLSQASQCALADCHADAGRRDLARELYRTLARNRWCSTALLPAIASGLGRVGDNEAALDVCRELARREPDRHEAYFGMAHYMRRIGHESAAVLPVVARAQELSPESPIYRVLMASLLAELGRYEEACTLLRDVRPDAVSCAGCLRRIMTILHQGGADDALSAYQAHFAWNRGPFSEESM